MFKAVNSAVTVYGHARASYGTAVPAQQTTVQPKASTPRACWIRHARALQGTAVLHPAKTHFGLFSLLLDRVAGINTWCVTQ